MRINTPEIIERGDRVRIESCIEHGSGADCLWYEIDRGLQPYLTNKLDGFLVPCLLRAMVQGESIYVDGAVSETLWYNLTNSYMPILRLAFPNLKCVEVEPRLLDNGSSYECANAVGTGFSAGIDSFCVLVDHFLSCPYPNYRITHCVFNNVGAHELRSSDASRRLFHSRYKIVRACLDELGVTAVPVDSNLTEFVKMDFPKSHVPRNLSTILMLQGLFGKYLYASTYHYRNCHFGETYEHAYTDPAAVHLFSTETLRSISTGCQYSRVQKTDKISDWDLTRRYLNVCIHPDPKGGNCSTCEKCCRTLLTLELLGKLEGFGNVFDLKKYRGARSRFLLKCFLSKDHILSKEIVDLCREQHAPVGLHVRALAALPFSGKIKAALKLMERVFKSVRRGRC